MDYINLKEEFINNQKEIRKKSERNLFENVKIYQKSK